MSTLEIEGATLAIDGGAPSVEKYEGVPQRSIGVEEFMELADSWGFNDETKAIIEAAIAKDDFVQPLLSRYYNPRPSKVAAFENLVSEMFDVPHVLAVNSGTSALNTAYMAAGLGPGDEVIVPAYTFFATVAEVVIVGAIPIIAEIDESLTIDPIDIERKITPRTKAIAPVHINGTCCDMDAIMDIARRHNLIVIEDTAQACGGSYKGRKLGTIGDFGCFSISSYKLVGGGEGGLVTTHDPFLFTRAQNNHDTGACWRPDRFAIEQREGELFCGYNFKMSELEGAVNLAQIRKLQDRIDRWHHVKSRVVSQLGHYEGITPQAVRDSGEVGNFLVFFGPDAAGTEKLVEALVAEGIPATGRGGKTSRDWHIYSYWEHIMQQKSSSPDGFPWTHPKNAPFLPDYQPDMCPKTLDLMSRAVMIHVIRDWADSDCDRVAAGINKVLGAYHQPLEQPLGW
jgi:8-amino-3,8-dideoxy-alpha-D-manno-octulosonate transaminase